MKPIETIYNGYRFRSRLEARWAVFFDVLGIKWVYEPEGYDLGRLGYYLPDFWLTEIGCFAEVKPQTFTEVEWNKASALPQHCLVLDGVPENKYYTVAGDPENHGDFSSYGEYLQGKTYYCADLLFSKSRGRIWWIFMDDAGFTTDDRHTNAINAARSARFEFGDRAR
jgi:hypothetical protein